MIDLKLLQKDFDTVAKKLHKKGVSKELLLDLKTRVTEHKTTLQEYENLKATQNKLSKEFGVIKKNGGDIDSLKNRVNQTKQDILKINEVLQEKEDSLLRLAQNIPNLPDDDVPEGISEDDNIEIKKVLEPTRFDFKPKEHYELAQKLDWLDFNRGVKLAKSRFTVLKNDAAKLERALINYMIDFNTKRGFKEVWLPVIANKETLYGTGQLPKFEEDLFKIDGEDLYLIPTAEVALTNLFRDEIIDSKEFPIKLTAYTACFRKEAGSAGRDTKGIIRQHQFDKVEIVAITKPTDSDMIFDEMVKCASDLLTSLKLPHRLVMLCGGDLGFSASKTIDIEVWLPGQNRYREISSISNTREFQARRSKNRYKDGKKTTLCHTLNGSSLAVGRTLIAIMENYQNKDGSITIPEVLKEYIK